MGICNLFNKIEHLSFGAGDKTLTFTFFSSQNFISTAKSPSLLTSTDSSKLFSKKFLTPLYTNVCITISLYFILIIIKNRFFKNILIACGFYKLIFIFF